ncbi:MAG: hypothetical protein ABL996_19600 [Micropepsaceae bacterium]
MERHKSETPLAWLTLAGAALHFSLETYYHFTWGQPLQALLVDYICNGLMLLGGMRSLRVRPGSAAGLIAAGWAFALGFGWRSVFGRLELAAAHATPANGEPSLVLPILMAALSLVVVILIWSLALAWRQSRRVRG